MYIDIVHGYAITGRDVGVMWIEDGVIYFAGHRTSFAITGAMLETHKTALLRRWPSPAFERRLEIRLRPTCDGMRRQLQLDVPWVGDFEKSSLAAMANTIQEVAKGPASGEAGQYPPTGLGPEAQTFLELGWQLGKRSLALPAVLSILWLGFEGLVRLDGLWGVFVLPGVLALIFSPVLMPRLLLSIASLVRAWISLRELQRLRSG